LRGAITANAVSVCRPAARLTRAAGSCRCRSARSRRRWRDRFTVPHGEGFHGVSRFGRDFNAAPGVRSMSSGTRARLQRHPDDRIRRL